MKDKDIAIKRIEAIIDKGTKQDFVDLYEIIKRGNNLEGLLRFYNKKYHLQEENKLNIIKRLQYFDDAEEDDMPKMIKQITWEEVKDFFAKETIRLAKKYI